MVPDLDSDDGGGWWFRMNVAGESRTYFATRVSYDPLQSSADDVRYLNVLGDRNGNGVWDADEWQVRNHAFDFASIPAGVNSKYVVFRVDDFDPAAMLDKYTRVTLSTTEVAGSSGAWGELARGETEDWTSSFVAVDTYGTGPLTLPVGKIRPMTIAPAGPVGGCPICGVPGVMVPYHPGHAAGHTWTIAAGAPMINAVGYYSGGFGDGVSPCGDSFVAGPGGPVPINQARGTKLGNLPGAAQVYGSTVGLIPFGGIGHGWEKFTVGYHVDPDGTWLEVVDWDTDYLVAVPEPGSLAALAMGVMTLMGISIRRKK